VLETLVLMRIPARLNTRARAIHHLQPDVVLLSDIEHVLFDLSWGVLAILVRCYQLLT
jgi:hypothetical protein